VNATVLPPRPTEPPRKRSAWEVQRAVLFALVLREMKARVGGQWVGAVWTLIEPLTHVMIMVTILGSLRAAGPSGTQYPVFLVTGLLPFFLFQHLAMRLMDGIDANRGLFSYRQVKPLDTLLSRACIEALMNLLVYAFTLGILAWLGYSVTPAGPLEMIGVNLMLILLGTGFGVFTAVATHERPRLRSFVRMMMLPLYFASGVIFQVDVLPREYLDWLLLNPVLHLVELSRHAFLSAYVPAEGVNATYPLLCTLVVGALAMLLYYAERLRLVTSA
jgi:capsular polysaccharide transport system permease protein